MATTIATVDSDPAQILEREFPIAAAPGIMAFATRVGSSATDDPFGVSTEEHDGRPVTNDDRIVEDPFDDYDR